MFYKIQPEAEQTKVMPQCCSGVGYTRTGNKHR